MRMASTVAIAPQPRTLFGTMRSVFSSSILAVGIAAAAWRTPASGHGPAWEGWLRATVTAGALVATLLAVTLDVGLARTGPIERGGLPGALRSGAGVLWPVAVAWLFVPIVTRVMSLDGSLPMLITILAGVLVTLNATARQGQSAGGVLFAPVSVQSERPWRFAALVFSVALTASYVAIAARARGNNDNDSAYYYAVAKHIVATGRYEEPIVWHYLNKPDSIVHRPFDYWQGLTSWVLVPPMKLLGASPQTALVTMALVSSASVVGFAAIVMCCNLFAYRLTQVMCIAIFAFSPAMSVFRFDTETSPVVHLLLVVALWALWTGRPTLSVISAAFLPLTRSDGALLGLALFAIAGYRAHRVAAYRLDRRVVSLLATMAFGVGAIAVLNVIVFARLIPPGVACATHLADYWDLYRFYPRLVSGETRLRAMLGDDGFADRASVGVSTLWNAEFVPFHGLWFALGLYPKRRAGNELAFARTTTVMLLLGISAVTAWASPIVFTAFRTLHGLLPLFVLAGAFGFDALLSALDGWQRRGWPLLRQAVAATLVLVLFVPVASRIRPYGERRNDLAEFEDSLRRLDPILRGEAVASTRPWQVISSTRSPAISIPADGETAISDAIARYNVRWLLLSEACYLDSREVCARISDHGGGPLGRWTLSLAASQDGVSLYGVAP